MDALIYALGVIAFFLGLLVSIALHEVGHMVPAKKFGVKVTQYFVGFGKTVWSFRRGETEYGIKAFPLGGYVKLVGMLPPDKSVDSAGNPVQRVRASNTGMFTQLISDARAAEYDNVLPGEEDRLFYRKPWWQKLIVMSGGPLVNVFIAIALFSIVIMGFGLPKATTTVSAVSDCVIPATAKVQTCQAGDPVAPALQAGLKPGDVIRSFNGTPITSWGQLTGLIRDNNNGSAVIGISRGGRAMTLHTNTLVSSRPQLNDPSKDTRVGFLGVTPTEVNQRGNPLTVLSVMWDDTVATGAAIGHLPQKMVGVFQAAFGGKRDANSPVSVVGASRVAGEVVSQQQASWSDRIGFVIGLLAALNLFVALFNFIPLLPLDGGHIAGALWEAVRRGVARLRSRPDPGYVDVAKMLPVAYAVAGVLMIMGVVLIYADIVNPVTLN
ncbi:MAG: M50 family metallopeptidase [Nocardioidaceae bacterium]